MRRAVILLERGGNESSSTHCQTDPPPPNHLSRREHATAQRAAPFEFTSDKWEEVDEFRARP